MMRPGVLLLGLTLWVPCLAAGQKFRLEREGVRLDLELAATEDAAAPLRQDRSARISLRLRNAADGEPLRNRRPSAWLDFADASASCAQQVGGYRAGGSGRSALLDLNGYYVLLLNRDASIAVIDPQTRFDGKTNLLRLIPLPGRGLDWIKGRDDRRIFVAVDGATEGTQPRASPGRHQVAVIDGDGLEVEARLVLPAPPGRLALPPDGRLLWVSHDGRGGGRSGISVVDTATLQRFGFVDLPPGHHEFAFSEDSGRVMVTSRDGGSVSLLDARTRRVLKRIGDFGQPIAVGYSASAAAFFVADGRRGTVTAFNRDGTRRGQPVVLEPGLGPLRISGDGRWVLVLNPAGSSLTVVDSADLSVRQRLPVEGRPYLLELSARYAYVRSLDSERVGLIRLASLDEGQAALQQVAVGAGAPGLTPELPLASGMAPLPVDGAMFLLSPTDNAVYFYMEGMNAPSGSLQAHGHEVRAVTAVARGLREQAPGTYRGHLRLPAAGALQLAVALDTPGLVECFPVTAAAAANPEGKEKEGVGLRWLEAERTGSPAELAARIHAVTGDRPLTGLRDVHFVLMRIGGGARRLDLPTQETAPGVYRAVLPRGLAGSYYAHLGIDSRGVKPGDLPYRSLSLGGEAPVMAGGVAP